MKIARPLVQKTGPIRAVRGAHGAWLAIALALVIVPAAGGELAVTVANVQAERGQVRIAVYDETNWLSTEEWVDRALLPAGETVQATFRLPRGRYAVAVLHDLNDNGRMDYRLLRLPAEPYGFSNGAKPRLGAPKFKAAAFDLGEKPLVIVVRLVD